MTQQTPIKLPDREEIADRIRQADDEAAFLRRLLKLIDSHQPKAILDGIRVACPAPHVVGELPRGQVVGEIPRGELAGLIKEGIVRG